VKQDSSDEGDKKMPVKKDIRPKKLDQTNIDILVDAPVANHFVVGSDGTITFIAGDDVV
jgi:hypothetical protein